MNVKCTSAVINSYAKKKKLRLEYQKESITKGPGEMFLKASAEEHPALHGLSAKHQVAAFESLGLRSDLCQTLATLNIHQPTSIQIAAMPKIMEGQNVLCTSPAGSGKTLAYLLPIIHLLKNQEDIEGLVSRKNRPRACIVVPFRELAIQVLDVVKSLSHIIKLRSLGIISGRKKKWICEGLSNPVDIVVATPQTLLKYQQKGEVYLSDLSHLVVDEADTMLDESFISMAVDILKFVGVTTASRADKYQPVQTMFIATTVPHDVISIMDSIVPNMHICNTGLHQVLPHVSQKFVKIAQHKKSELLIDTVSKELKNSPRQIMVFCNTTKSCDWTSYILEEQGIPQTRLNGNMTKKERRLHLKRFQEMKTPILVCTNIASRGLDTTNVSHVINFDFPVNIVDYMHRAGRVGRLGCSFGQGFQPQVTSFLSHNKELIIMDQIKNAIQKTIPVEDATFRQRHPARKYKRTSNRQ